MLIEISFQGDMRTKYVYRGLSVPEIENTSIMIYPGCCLTVYHWEGNAEDTLIISRNKLTPESRDTVYKDFIETCDYSFARYIKFLAEYTNSQNIDAVEYESFAVVLNINKRDTK